MIEFDPHSKEAASARKRARGAGGAPYVGYVYTKRIELAVRVALATRRPLLLRGDPGVGKSTLARDVALCLGWRYYTRVVSSRMQARDLMWRFDAVERLGDAQVGRKTAEKKHRYIDPGVLWWAFDRATATRRGGPSQGKDAVTVADPKWLVHGKGEGAVVLVDEIDKAEPDVPNDLLEPLGEGKFHVDELELDVTQKNDVLLAITTNGERELPEAFLRRCVVLSLPRPGRERLWTIAQAHFPRLARPTFDRIAVRFDELAAKVKTGRLPGTAELLDAIRAVRDLEPSEDEWRRITLATLWKQREPPDGEGEGEGE